MLGDIEFIIPIWTITIILLGNEEMQISSIVYFLFIWRF